MSLKNQLSYSLKEKFIKLFFNSPVLKKRFIDKLQNTIIMYHGVSTSEQNIFNTRHVGVKSFQQQMLFLKKNCNIISLSDFHQKKFDPLKINVALTFDDGYQNNFTIAKPILEELKIPATFYVTGLNEINQPILWADHLDIVSRFYQEKITIEGINYYPKNGNYFSDDLNAYLSWVIKNKHSTFDFKQMVMSAFPNSSEVLSNTAYFEYWKLMTDQQISETGKSRYIEIGSHGYFHNNLGNIPFNDAKDELIKSKLYLENLIQKEVNSIGYPDGSYSREIIGYSSEIGMQTQVAAEGFLFPEDHSDDRILDRKGIYNFSDSNNQLFNALKR